MTAPSLEVRAFDAQDLAACTRLLSRLPHWFGIEASNRAYLAGLSELPALVAVAEEGQVVGFASLRSHGPHSSEIEILAVDPALHRRGIGRTLVAALEHEVRRPGATTFFHVKTLGPSAPDENYARTRAFYAAIGFTALFETTALWGPENPALVLIKTLD